MKLLEIIELRTNGKKKKEVEDFLSTWKKQSDHEGDTGYVILNYKHMHISEDYSIHLKCTLSEYPKKQTAISDYLISSLKKFGLVNYSAWVEHSKADQDHLTE